MIRASATTILLCLVIGSFAIGCASSKSNGAKLSEAMAKASDDNRGSRKVRTDTDDDDASILGTTIDVVSLLLDTSNFTPSSAMQYGPPVPQSVTAKRDSSRPTWFSLAGGAGFINHKALYGLNHVDVRMSTMMSERTRLALIAGVEWAPVQQTSNLARSIDGGIIVLNGRVQFNWYTTPPHTFLGQYFTLGGGYNYMLWEYRNDVIVNGARVSNDALEGIDLFGGIGINLIQTRGFHLGGELTPGIILWVPITDEGFENDVFEPFPYVKFTAVMSLGS